MSSKQTIHQFLKDAYRMVQKGRYRDASVLLEKVIESGVDDPYPRFLLSVSYLYLDMFSRAAAMLREAGGAGPDYMPAVQLDAFLRLKAAPGYEEALKLYLGLIERYPADAHLRRARRIISGAKDFSKLQKSARLHNFVELPSPPARFRKARLAAGPGHGHVRGTPGPVVKYPEAEKGANRGQRRILKAAVIVIPMLLLTAGGYLFFSRIHTIMKTGTAGKDIDMVTIGGNDYDLLKRVNRKEHPEFYNNVDDMKRDFDKARGLIKKGEMNKALRLLNKIGNSNVSYIVKEKVEFLVRFVRDSDERVYEKIPVKQTGKRPWLYRGFAVSWTGKIANLKKKKKGSTFTMLVDYRGRDVFSATVEVYTEADVHALENGDIVDMEGILMNRIAGGSSMYVVGKSVRRVDSVEGAGGK